MQRDWRESARCRGLPDEQRMRMFFPDGKPERSASWPTTGCVFCQGCTERRKCLSEAIRLDDGDGIYGGVRPDLRVKLAHRFSLDYIMAFEDNRVSKQRAAAAKRLLDRARKRREWRRDAKKKAATREGDGQVVTLLQVIEEAS